MGGSRSGRHAWRNVGTVGSRLSLDVRDLARLGALAPGVTAKLRWESGSTIGMHCEAGRVTLVYAINGGEHCRERLLLEHQPCHFGGSRHWLRCPG